MRGKLKITHHQVLSTMNSDKRNEYVTRDSRLKLSAASFALFALVPIAGLFAAAAPLRIPAIAALSLVSLAALGAFGGHLGGAPLGRAALRVTLGGALAMAVTAAIGRILGVSVG